MSLTNLPFERETISNINAVYKEIGIDADKVENCLKLVKEWLKCESYLPNVIDEILLRNFILGCKGNVQKTKQKLEKYLVARTTITFLYRHRSLKEEDYFPYPHHRLMAICPKQTPEGNRIIIIRVPQKDPTNFDNFIFAKYFCLICDVLLSHDISAGYHFIYDVSWFSPKYLSKLILTVSKQVSEIFYNILPFRVKSLLIINNSSAFEVLMSVGKVFMSKKLQDRIVSVKIEDLSKYHPINCLPNDYGGTQKSYNELCDEMFEYMKGNSEWCSESEKLKLIGPVPEHHKNMYSFEDFDMHGSFRKLAID